MVKFISRRAVDNYVTEHKILLKHRAGYITLSTSHRGARLLQVLYTYITISVVFYYLVVQHNLITPRLKILNHELGTVRNKT